MSTKKEREYRGVMDEIREQNHKLKDMTPKEKAAYLWEYYRFHALAVICLVALIVYFIHAVTTSKDYCFYALMVNSQPLSSEAVGESFAEYADLDIEHYDCYIDTNTTLDASAGQESDLPTAPSSEYDMVIMQKIIAMSQTNELDAIVFDENNYETYAKSQMFLDLRTVLSSEEIQKYEPYFYYVDYEDEKHVPVGIYLDSSSFVEKSECYAGSHPVFGISVTSLHQETAVQYLNYLFDESIAFDTMLKEPLL